MEYTEATYTVFVGDDLLAAGALGQVLPVMKDRFDEDPGTGFLTLEDHSGRQVDFDLRGSLAQVLAAIDPPPRRPGPGRPRLGVVSREVSLLPRHWEWLEAQPQGASAALRRLVDAARQQDQGPFLRRQATDALGRVLTTLAGDRAGYEEASRALYAGDLKRFSALIAPWPAAVVTYLQSRAQRLA